MAVHDGERRRLDDAFALALGDALPRVALAGGVEIDPVRLQPLGIRLRHRPERLEALRERRRDVRIRVDRRDAGDEVDAVSPAKAGHHIFYEQRAHLHAAEVLQRADVAAQIRLQPVDRRRTAVHLAEAGVLHRDDRRVVDRAARRTTDLLEHHHRLPVRFLRRDLRLSVLDRPAGGELELEAQPLVQEPAAPDDALLGAVAPDEALHLLQVAVAVGRELLRAGFGLAHRRLHTLHAILRLRMRLQPVGHALAVARLFDASERRQHPRNARGIPARARRVADAEAVRLRFVVSTVFQQEQPQPRAAGLRDGRSAGGEDRRADQADLRERGLRVLRRRVPRGDVPDLMAEDTGQLRLVVQEGEDSARYIDVAAGKRERVDGRDVRDGEMPGQARTFGRLRELHADGRHVLLQRAVVVRTHFLPDLDVVLLSERDLLLLAHEGELALARRGVRRAGTGETQCRQDGPPEGGHYRFTH